MPLYPVHLYPAGGNDVNLLTSPCLRQSKGFLTFHFLKIDVNTNVPQLRDYPHPPPSPQLMKMSSEICWPTPQLVQNLCLTETENSIYCPKREQDLTTQGTVYCETMTQ